MDRIYKALELAREENLATKGAAVAPEKRAPEPLYEVDDRPEEIAYTRTKIVPVSEDALRRNRIIAAPVDPVIEAGYKLLRTRVLRILEQNQWKTIGVTSARSSEGKTLTAINLALAIARDPKYSVLLVDADLRRPTVHKALGMEPEYGLEDYLGIQTPLDQVLINPGIDRFVVLPSCSHLHGSSEHLSSRRMSRLVNDLKARYASRFVMFDLPPVLLADDVIAFSEQLDAVLIVVEEGKSQTDDLERMLELLGDTRILGTVLNKVTERDKSFDRYYGPMANRA